VSHDPSEEIRIVQVAGKERKSRPGCFFAFLFVVIAVILISRVLSPSDWVEVTVGPLPESSQNWCVIAEDSDGVRPLSWYHSKVFPFTDNPFHGGDLMGPSWLYRSGFVTASVQWREAKRYGILIQLTDDEWRLYWLEPQEVFRPSIMRYIIGGDSANMHLPAEARAHVPSKQLLKQLGYSP
jgi:hypothetical protein